MSDAPSWTERLFGGFRKTSDRLSENLAAADLALTRDDLIAIDAHFPPPRRRVPLAMS